MNDTARTLDATAPAAPVSGGERLVALDWLRGFAVLGILLANITVFSNNDVAYYYPDALPGGAYLSDKLAWLAQFVLVDGKMRGIFTILFGAGMVLFIEKFGATGKGYVVQIRRLALLAAFGAAHFYLLFKGDILFSYACAGFFALFAVPLTARLQLSIGIVWALAGAALQGFAYVPAAMGEAGSASFTNDLFTQQFFREFWEMQLEASRIEGEVIASGSYPDIVAYRVLSESRMLVSGFVQGFYETIPLMLIGMGLYRTGVFARGREEGDEERPHWHGLALAALTLGVVLNVATGLIVFASGFPPFLTQLAFFGASQFANVFVLVGGVPLLARYAMRANGGWLGTRLVAAGRMAFSNYIGTSLVMMLVFHGWAGGLFGRLHRLELYLVVALGWLLMLAWSRPWLDRYRQGPLEWVWRCLSYGRWFPLRR